MKFARLLTGSLALVAFGGVSLFYAVQPARSFDPKDSPVTAARLGADISGVYFFPSPTNSNDVVAVMDVYPEIPAGAGLSTYFDQSVLYTMKFDTKWQTEATSQRGTEQLVMQFSVSAPASGTQEIYFYGLYPPVQTGSATKLVNGGNTTAVGLINKTFNGGSGITIFAGAREDPSFFDLNQFYNIVPDRNLGSTSPSCLPASVVSTGTGACPNGFNTPGNDFFLNTDVLSIVVEMPLTLLVPTGSVNGSQVAFWATTSTASGH